MSTTSVVYSHETVSLDGQVFSDCEFLKSRLIYAGGEPPIFEHCRFQDCEWRFDDAAGRTLAYLKNLWGAGEKASVQAAIKEITGVAR
jgi:hypothetical protein